MKLFGLLLFKILKGNQPLCIFINLLWQTPQPMGALGFLRAWRPRKLLADFFLFFVWGLGRGLGLLGEMWPIPFLQKDGINGEWTLQGISSWLPL